MLYSKVSQCSQLQILIKICLWMGRTISRLAISSLNSKTVNSLTKSNSTIRICPFSLQPYQTKWVTRLHSNLKSSCKFHRWFKISSSLFFSNLNKFNTTISKSLMSSLYLRMRLLSWSKSNLSYIINFWLLVLPNFQSLSQQHVSSLQHFEQ